VAHGSEDDVESLRERYLWASQVGVVVVVLFSVVFLIGAAGGFFGKVPRVAAPMCLVAYLLLNRLVRRALRGPFNPNQVMHGAMLAFTFLMATGMYITGGLSSPMLVLYGPMAAVVGLYMPFRSIALVSTLSASLLLLIGLAELNGVIPHVPLFADGSDPGLYRHAGYVWMTASGVLVKMWTIALGTDYLTRKLRQRETELRTKEQERWAALGQFSAVVAHEVKNPLTGIKGAAALIEKESVSPTAHRMARAIGEEVERLDRLVASYLRFARPLPINQRPLSVNDVVKRVIAMHAPSGNGGPRVEYELAEGLPEIRGDADQLYEALLNLLENARQASPENGEIRFVTRAVGDGVEVEVADGGPGIPPALLPKIFEPFFTTKTRGSGLGLAVVRRIVEGHGGTVRVENPPGGGAKFTMRFERGGR